MTRRTLLFAILFSMQLGHSQILISLLFGDKLNTPRSEFGLDGGMNFSNISNLEQSKSNMGLNLGFYFDYKLKNPSWMLNTGVIVKSSMGASKLAVYPLENANLDASFAGGTVSRELRYFNVPILIKYKFDSNIFLKAGPQFGLLHKAFDKFKNEYDDENLKYKYNIKDKIHAVDAGLSIGAGYRLMSGNGINIGVNYYQGLVPIMKGDASPNQFNRSFSITAGIPIGIKK